MGKLGKNKYALLSAVLLARNSAVLFARNTRGITWRVIVFATAAGEEGLLWNASHLCIPMDVEVMGRGVPLLALMKHSEKGQGFAVMLFVSID